VLGLLNIFEIFLTVSEVRKTLVCNWSTDFCELRVKLGSHCVHWHGKISNDATNNEHLLDNKNLFFTFVSKKMKREMAGGDGLKLPVQRSSQRKVVHTTDVFFKLKSTDNRQEKQTNSFLHFYL
jgi:hypothetical protein